MLWRSTVGSLWDGDLSLDQLHCLSVISVSISSSALVRPVVCLKQSVNLRKIIIKLEILDIRLYPEGGEGGGWTLVKVGHVEVIVTLD